MVEFAILLPVFVSLAFGMITAGNAYNTKMQMTHAIRDGSRYGSTMPEDAVFTSGTWGTNVRDNVVNASVGQLSASQVCVALVNGVNGDPVGANWVSNPFNPGARCFDDGGIDSGKRVQVMAQRGTSINAFFFRLSPTLNTKAVDHFEK